MPNKSREIDLAQILHLIVTTDPCENEIVVMVETHRPLETKEVNELHRLWLEKGGNNNLRLGDPCDFHIKEGRYQAKTAQEPVFRNIWTCKVMPSTPVPNK